jgi:hypothetical protein
MTKIYSNPRLQAHIENWPSGGQRVTAQFFIETNGARQRAVRITTGAPKKLTYANQARIVDGDDGRTYIAEDNFSHITIMRGDMKLMEEAIFPHDSRYPMAKALFNQPTET